MVLEEVIELEFIKYIEMLTRKALVSTFGLNSLFEPLTVRIFCLCLFGIFYTCHKNGTGLGITFFIPVFVCVIVSDITFLNLSIYLAPCGLFLNIHVQTVA